MDAMAGRNPSTNHEQTGAEPRPVALAERIRSLDLLRGVAVLGILLINIWAYAHAFPASMSPDYVGCNSPTDRVVLFVVWMLAYTKFMPIFSMLFGAGVVLFCERVEARGLKARGLFYRRQLWLLLFGLVHAYLLWFGDILVPYALCGAIVVLLRSRRPRTLVVLAVLSILVPIGLMQLGAGHMGQLQTDAEAAEAAVEAGESLTDEQQELLEEWREQRVTWDPTEHDVAEIEAAMRSPYGRILEHTVPEVLMMHLALYPFIFNWLIAGFMLIGMALFKAGWLSGEKPARVAASLASVGYGVGLPLAAYAYWLAASAPGSVTAQMRMVFPVNTVSGLLVALGHVGLIVLACQKQWLGAVGERLAAAGRMAFTNYISQTLICITIFYGFGFALFGTMNRLQLIGVVVAVWLLQLWWSPLWLRHFRFGPLEWLWRSLTYRRLQPFRR